MKNIILIVSLLLLSSCNAQKNNNSDNEKMKYYNADQYNDWDKDSKYLSSYSEDDKYLMKGNERVRIWIDEKIHIEKSNVITPYTFYKAYSSKNKSLLSEWVEFYRTFTGIDRQYNKNGKLILQEDQDKPYPFSIEDLIKKFKREYNVDIENRKNVFQFFRNKKMREFNIPFYKVILKTEIENEWIEYLVDGNTGKTLYIMKSSEGDETNLIEEYLKSIGKFKGTPSKSDPATSQRSSPLSNEELGKSYAYGDAVPQNTHQIYEGKAYTKTEWETFQKSLPWWKKIL